MDALLQSLQLLANNMKELCRKQAESEKVVLFMDNSNLYGSLARLRQDIGRKYRIDYQKLYRKLIDERFCINASCYCSEWEIDGDQKLKRDSFQVMMQKAGFQVIRLPQRAGSVREKGLDTSVVRDMMTMARDCPRADTFILIAGDGDYSDTVSELRHKYGLKVEVAFFMAETANTLKEAAFKFIDLDSMVTQIQLVDHNSE